MAMWLFICVALTHASTFCGAVILGNDTIAAPVGEHTVAFPTSEATKSFVPRPIHIRESGIVEGGVEYVCYDTASKRVFAVNSATSTLDSYTLDTAGMISARTVEYSNFTMDGYKPQSCAVNAAQGVVVVATEAGQAAGKLYAFKLSDRTLVTHISAGALPDHVTCSSDGSFCVCANEGEPSDDLSDDPVGGITVLTASDWMDNATYVSSTYSLSGVVDSVSAGQHRVHTSIPSPTTTFDADLEPEFIAMSAATTSSSGKVYIALQENNAIIEFDMGTRQYTQLMPLGWKNLTIVTGDYSDKDDVVQMRAGHVRLVSMYQPDSMLVVTQQGKDYIIMANEGDAKDYSGFSEEARAADLMLNPAFFSAQDISDFGNSTLFGRLKVTTQAGKNTSGDTYNYVVGYGGRSWSVLDPSTGTMVWDSADQIAMMEAKYWEAGFQSAGTTASKDSRSDDKGAEPESIAYGMVSGTPYVFVGLERTSLIGAWDVTDIANPVFAGFGGTADCGASEVEMAHRDPEAMVFVEAGSSPTGQAMLIAGGSYTGTLATFNFHLHDGQTSGECMRCYLNAPTSCGYGAPSTPFSPAPSPSPGATVYNSTGTVSLPLTKVAFDAPAQDKFRASVAATAETSPDLVGILNVTEVNLSQHSKFHITATSIEILVSIQTTMMEALNVTRLNTNLQLVGLPAATSFIYTPGSGPLGAVQPSPSPSPFSAASCPSLSVAVGLLFPTALLLSWV